MEYKAWRTIIQKIDNFELKKGLTTFVNPFSMSLLKDRNDIVENIDYWYIDGISLVNMLNKYFKLKINRYSFDDTSLAPVVFNYAKKNNLTIAIIGTKEEYLHKAVNTIIRKFSVNVAYSHHGYFTNQNRAECIKHITNEKFDIVICGMGTPHQEEFLIDLVKNGWFGYGYTCGGYLHQIAHRENYYPTFFDNLNIRWLYRIIDEPKLFSRYLIDYPRFYVQLHLHKNTLNNSR